MTDEQGMALMNLFKCELKGFKVVDKNKSAFMKFLSWLPPFLFMRKKFMRAITTIGRTCYWPAPGPNMTDPMDVALLYHEWTHAKIGADMGWFLYGLLYLFPQVFALLALSALPAAWYSNLWLIGLVPLLALGPWPAHWRVKFEMQCTSAEIVVYNAIWGGINPEWIEDRIERLFCSVLYWFPCWSKNEARKKLRYLSKRPEAGRPPIWKQVSNILKGILPPMPPMHGHCRCVMEPEQ